MLTVPQTLAWLNAHGFGYNLRQVRRMATDKKLPFRVGPDGRQLYCPESALMKFVAVDPAQ